MSWLVLGRDSAAQFPSLTISAGRPGKTLQQFQRLLLNSDFHTRFAYLAWMKETSKVPNRTTTRAAIIPCKDFARRSGLCPGKSLREYGTRSPQRHTAREDLEDPGQGYVLS